MEMWPETYQGAISLTFDDGMASHLKIALPEMNKRGLLATFYLNPRSQSVNLSNEYGWRDTLELWKPAQAAGHEIGNHTVDHPCSLNVRMEWQAGKNLLDWTLEKIEANIAEAQKRINFAFPAQRETSFAYPCYESTVGRGVNRTSYTPVVARYCIAARARGELRGDLANDTSHCDLHHLSSWAVERQPGAFMIGLVEQAIAHGRWGIFTFHGIHEGHLPVGDTDFIELLDHLQRRKDAVWVAPVARIAAHINSTSK